MKTLKPSYYTNFECIGSECKDTCCAGWTINMNKESYKKYTKLKPSTFKLELEKNIKRIKSSKSENLWATIKLDEDKRCPFLDEKSLCNVYKEIGKDYLPSVCKTYPRILNYLGDIAEFSLTTSCIEVSRLVLSKKEGIDFLLEDEKIDLNALTWSRINHLDTKAKTKGEKNFNLLREYSITVMQERSLSIEERLIVLGLFFSKVDATDDLDGLIKNSLLAIKDGAYKNASDVLTVNNTFQFNVLTSLYNTIVRGTSTYYNKLTQEVKRGLSVEDGTTLDMQKYKQGKIAYNEVFKKYDYILENYIVNHMFSKLFPLEANTLFDAYIYLIVNIGLLKFHLIGLCASKGTDITEKELIEAITGYSRKINHSEVLDKITKEFFEINDFKGLSYVLTFVL